MGTIRQAISIADLEDMARRRLPEFAFRPVETGSGDGSCPERNRRSFAQFLWKALALVDVNSINQGVTLFGRRYSSPFGISAVGHAGNLRRNADEMLAAAAVASNIPFMLSGASTASIETIARIAPDHVWQQLYAAKDRAITDDIVGRARDNGVQVLVYTVDSPVRPKNNWLAGTGIRLPAYVPVRAWPYVLWQCLLHPAWAAQHVRHLGLPRMESWAPYAPKGARTAGVAKVFQDQLPSIQTWSDVERIRKLWPGRLVIKGIMDAGDACRSFDLGADAVTVSNHGGTKLDCLAQSIDVLPATVEMAGSRGPIFLDSGITRGMDVCAGLALGAQFCFVGRATLYGVVAGGQAGAERAIDILREEIERGLALIGCPDVAELSPDCLAKGRLS